MSDVAPVTALSAPTIFDDEPIVIEAEEPKPYNVELVGVKYRVLPVKMLGVISVGEKLEKAGTDLEKLRVELTRWLAGPFGRKVAPEVVARLFDPEDQLDLAHVMTLMRRLIERNSGNPTS